MIYWIITALVLVALEVLTQMVWTLCLAVGCLAAIVADLCGLDLAWQISVAGIVSVVAYFVLVPYIRRWQHRSEKRDGRDIRTGMDALLGRRGIVTADINPGSLGRVQIDGDNWQARAPHAGKTIPRGAKVIVDAYDSIILTVTADPNSAQ